MIPPCLLAVAIHALLHDSPTSIIRDDEAVQIQIETILNGGAVDLGHEAAHLRERHAIDPDAIADRYQFLGRLP